MVFFSLFASRCVHPNVNVNVDVNI
jgi:hypothetical protein